MFGSSDKSQRLKILKKNLPEIKINVFLRLNKKTTAWVNNFSSKVVLTKDNQEIVFAKNSLLVPHISLIKGFLNNGNDLSKIKKIVKNVASQFKKISVDFSKLVITEDNKWIMLYLENNQELQKLIESLKTELKSYITIKAYDAPHITLAKSNDFSKLETLIKSYNLPSKFVSSGIGVGLCGNAGVVLKVLHKANFKSYENK